MPFLRGAIFRAFLLSGLILWSGAVFAAQNGNAGAIHGTVTDPTGAVIPGATVRLSNSVTSTDRTATTDGTGQFSFANIAFNPYQLSVNATGFEPLKQAVEVRSSVAINLNLVLQIVAAATTVTVEATTGDLVENDPTFHTDVDRDQFSKVPLESMSSSMSSLVTATTPGASADSNGMVHGLGDHAENSFSVDGQSITDQQSKTFSNQLPSNSIQSMEVISGAPPAEYGGKTSLVIVATTRSGQGVTKPTGSISGSYGTFGSATYGLDLAYGGQKWGNFVELDGLNTGRFLDPPEFAVMHDKGNEENLFDRVDYTFTPADSMHVDMNYSRSWFQNPNAFDNLNVENVVGAGAGPSPVFGNVGNTDQRSQIETLNFAPTYTHVVNTNSVFNLTTYIRRDAYHYYPSGNPLADLGPANLQTSSIAQYRTLTNAGASSSFSYIHGAHNFKAGAEYDTTFLRENDSLGVVYPFYAFSSPCMDAGGNPLAGYSNPSQCVGAATPNPEYLPVLAPWDLTRGGSYYHYKGTADIKILGMYVQDQIKAGNWTANLGVRGDLYKGLTDASQVEPRMGLAYNIKPSGSVLSVSYARSLETPFNENLVLASEGCGDPVLAPLLSCTPGVATTEQPGYRNEFHASLQQAIGKHLVASGEYIWKYTHNAFDFSVLGNTPITFPINWHNSKIPGYALHVEMPSFHNFTAYSVMSSVAARFFPPQVAGAGATVGHTGLPFRIDHDERFNQTAHVQYTIPHGQHMSGLWGGFNWHYDSGQVAGATPCYGVTNPNSPCGNSSTTLPDGTPAIAMVDTNIPATVNPVTGASVAIPLTADQEFQAGFMCNGQRATPGHPLPSVCPASEFSSSLINIPAPNTGDNDKSPQRIVPRSLFDVSVGKENIFNTDHYKVDLDLTAVNVANEYALYNFLSTFSGTHYVTPRSLTAKITLNF
ncbi:MAG TPA: TonB-dependent receptor [Terracidiphilus sp.]|nr:TonB-dependent receptor [Terracidiphilus sp.]